MASLFMEGHERLQPEVSIRCSFQPENHFSERKGSILGSAVDWLL